MEWYVCLQAAAMLLSLVVVVVVWNMCAALWLAGCHRMCAGRVRDVCVCWRIPTPPPPPCSADMLCELREQVVATGASIRIISPRGPDLDSALASACIGPLFPDVFESGAHQGAYQGAYQVGAPAAPCSAGGAEDRKPLWHPAVSTPHGRCHGQGWLVWPRPARHHPHLDGFKQGQSHEQGWTEGGCSGGRHTHPCLTWSTTPVFTSSAATSK